MPNDRDNGNGNGNKAADAAVTGVTLLTGTVGAAVGGVSRIAGDVVGGAGNGVGHTINNATRTHVVGDGLQTITSGVDKGMNAGARGIEEGSKGKNPFSSS